MSDFLFNYEHMVILTDTLFVIGVYFLLEHIRILLMYDEIRKSRRLEYYEGNRKDIV